jgi:hypothetical protein
MHPIVMRLMEDPTNETMISHQVPLAIMPLKDISVPRNATFLGVALINGALTLVEAHEDGVSLSYSIDELMELLAIAIAGDRNGLVGVHQRLATAEKAPHELPTEFFFDKQGRPTLEPR